MKEKDLKFVRDSSGNSPMTYAILKRSYESMNSLIQSFITLYPHNISKINQNELIDLFKLSPEKLPELLKNSTQTV